jgi:hypothetical protein
MWLEGLKKTRKTCRSTDRDLITTQERNSQIVTGHWCAVAVLSHATCVLRMPLCRQDRLSFEISPLPPQTHTNTADNSIAFMKWVVIFKILTGISTKAFAFWHLNSFSLVQVHRRFGWTFSLNIQDITLSPCRERERARSSARSVNIYQTTCPHIPHPTRR